MVKGKRPPAPGELHWTVVARQLAERTRGVSKAEKTAVMEAEAKRLGLTPHSLQRYTVLLDHLIQNQVRGADLELFATASLEVVLRIARIDPDEGISALKEVKAGTLTYRAALAIERRLKSVAPDAAAVPTMSDGDIRQRAATLLALDSDHDQDAASLIEIKPIEDERFAIVKVSKLFVAARYRSVAVVDGADWRGYVALGPTYVSVLRAVLLASAVYDYVLVRPGPYWNAGRFEYLRRMSRPGRLDNIVVIEDA